MGVRRMRSQPPRLSSKWARLISMLVVTAVGSLAERTISVSTYAEEGGGDS
jgi:hypothetical protein